MMKHYKNYFLFIFLYIQCLSAMEQIHNTIQLIPNDYAQTQKKFTISEEITDMFLCLEGTDFEKYVESEDEDIHLSITTPEVQLLSKVLIIESKKNWFRKLSIAKIKISYFLKHGYYPSKINDLVMTHAKRAAKLKRLGEMSEALDMADIPSGLTYDMLPYAKVYPMSPSELEELHERLTEGD